MLSLHTFNKQVLTSVAWESSTSSSRQIFFMGYLSVSMALYSSLSERKHAHKTKEAERIAFRMK